MMIRVQLVLRHFLRKLLSNPPLAHLLTNSRIELAHLTALSDSITLLLQRLSSLDRSSPSRRPDCKRFQCGTLWRTVCDQILSLSVVLLWVTVASRTLKMAVTGEMFQAPCLKDLREKNQAAGSDRTV